MKTLTQCLLLLTSLGAAAVQSGPAENSAATRLLSRLNGIRVAGVVCPGSGARAPAEALIPSALHSAAAARQADYMAGSGVVSHTGPDGSSPRVRALKSGIRSVSVSEIIYLGNGLNPEKAMQWWLHSPVHCSVMTDPRYTTAGASVVQGSQGSAYVIVLTSDPQ
ncbi:CAP domain-containing protein [Deinococcus sp.]|uniref:CAP domain-containing protein n=1 Tax=Deinococcus sp. TaxID=47478 RepID=UPI003CC59A0C